MNGRHAALLGAAALVAIVAALVDPIPQDPAYHDFADARTLLGVPRALDVLSNLPFLCVGFAGLARARRLAVARGAQLVLFAGVALTAFGSGWYHLSPDDARLVWDRLPMTLGFMGLLAALLGERVSPALGRALLVPLVLFGGFSVLHWHRTEQAGAGDLRLYALAQFGTLLLAALVVLLWPAADDRRRLGDRWLVGAFAGYALAKLAEHFDREIFAAGGLLSGHTLKHLLAAAAAACLVARLAGRAAAAPSRARFDGE